MLPYSRRVRAASLHMVLVIVSIMAFLAAAMTSLFTMNLNFTQATFNGGIAVDEAEAAIAEVMFRLQGDQNYGLGNQEIRGRKCPDYSDSECYHVVTFRSGTGFPHSVNNINGGNTSGYGGRTVPPGCVHVIATGFCRGQRREVEAVIEWPAFPYALCTSGPIHSSEPLAVYGVNQASDYPTRMDRPGHVISNHPNGIRIEKGTSTEATFVSGFVKSVGPISIDQPAEVLGGVKPFSGAMKLPDINIESFRNQGQAGTAEIVDGDLNPGSDGRLIMDVSYYCNHALTINGPMEMRSGLLFVENGDLVINGPLYGIGAVIVFNGNVIIKQGTNLKGQGQVALLTSGDLTFDCGDADTNYFEGMVYAEGNMNLKKCTVIGSVIANSPDPNKGAADIEEAVLVNTPTVNGKFSFTIETSSEVTTTYDAPQNTNPRSPFPTMWAGGTVGGGSAGWFSPNDPGWNNPSNNFFTNLTDYVGNLNDYGTGAGGGQLPDGTLVPTGPLGPPDYWPAPDAAGLIAQYNATIALVGQATTQAALIQSLTPLGPEPPKTITNEDGEEETNPAWEAWNTKKTTIETAQAELAALQQQIADNCAAMTTAYKDYYYSHTGNATQYNGPGSGPRRNPIDIPITIDINSYLTLSDKLKVSFWQVR